MRPGPDFGVRWCGILEGFACCVDRRRRGGPGEDGGAAEFGRGRLGDGGLGAGGEHGFDRVVAEGWAIEEGEGDFPGRAADEVADDAPLLFERFELVGREGEAFAEE
jgi:hypothetical protein